MRGQDPNMSWLKSMVTAHFEVFDDALGRPTQAVISLRVQVKNVYIRWFLGYVCQIAKVRVRMSFGWVSLFTQKY